jgi:hypothetical protein
MKRLTISCLSRPPVPVESKLDLEMLLSPAPGANRTPAGKPFFAPLPQSCSKPKSRGGSELEAIRIKYKGTDEVDEGFRSGGFRLLAAEQLLGARIERGIRGPLN